MVFVPFHHAYDGSQAIAQHPEYSDVYGKTPPVKEQTLKTNIASDKNISKGGALYLVFLVIVVVIALYTYNVYPVAFDRTRR